MKIEIPTIHFTTEFYDLGWHSDKHEVHTTPKRVMDELCAKEQYQRRTQRIFEAKERDREKEEKERIVRAEKFH